MSQTARILDLSPQLEAGEALAAAGAIAWTWTPGLSRLSLHGDATAFGIAPDEREDALDALIASLAQTGRRTLDAVFGRGCAEGEIAARLEHVDGARSLWRGRWDRHGGQAQGLALSEPTHAAAGRGTDGLTGLLDRAAFVGRLQAQLEAGRGARVMTADLARFRRLNATLGPDLADLVLAALGARLQAAFPPEAAAARVGEDEFAVLLPTGDDDVATRLRAALERPLRVAGCDVHPGFTLAEAQARPEEGASAGEVMRRAAAAMQALRSGPETLGGEPLQELSRMTLEGEVRGALGRGQLEPWFQPIVRLSDGRLAGFEALVRWRHPRLGLIPPDDFLPLLAEAKLMGALGRHMTRTCAARLAAWRAAFPAASDLFMTVNLTVGELEWPGLAEDVGRVIAETGLPPRALKLELTEGEVMRDPDAAVKVMQALRNAGAGLAIDDFGMGFSSLSYLTRLPVDTLKVDRYFVRTMAVSENSEKVMRSIVALGRDLGLQIVGEGVEDAAAEDRLREVGCTFGQGYGYARPLGREAAEEFLRERLTSPSPIRAQAASGVAGHA